MKLLLARLPIPAAIILFFGVELALAAPVSVTPAVLDYKVKARDIIEGQITITNTENRRVSLYPAVHNVNPASGLTAFVEPSAADLSSSLANWTSISRAALELDAKESRTLQFQIHVNLSAKPGEYHAVISFPEGATRAEAEARLGEAARVNVNAEVLADIKENLQLKKFATDKNIFWGLPAYFTYEVHNGGNRPETPRGSILIYDKRGKEVTELIVNKESYIITPGTSKVFSNEWRGSGAFGQYRAHLSIHYGAGEATKLQDTIFFWVLPWPQLALGGGIIFGICMGFLWWLHTRYVRAHGHRISHPTEVRHDHYPPHVVDLRHPKRK